MPAALTLAALLVVSADNPTTNGGPQVPNIVLMIADDCTYTDLGCYGGQAATPNLNRLCTEGARFDRCFQAAPMCSPTRHCLYTGLYPVRSGAYPNHTFVDKGTKSVAHYLQAAGYRTALSGKTHISPQSSFPFEYSKDGPETAGSNPDFAAIDSLIRDAKAAGQPFFAILASNEPHTPYTEGDANAYPPKNLTLPPHFVDTPKTREAFSRYLAEITYYDWQVGQMLDLLDRNDVADNTFVVVLSEQGSSFPFAKWTCYDAGVQSGMVVRWPGNVAAGTVNNAIVEYVDMTPTFVAVAGQDQPTHSDGKPLDGQSLLPLLRGQTDTHKSYTYSLQTTRGINNGSENYAIRSVRSERYRLIRNLNSAESFQNAVFTTDWWQEWSDRASSGNARAIELVARYSNRPAVELYDCLNDPWNTTNLAGQADLAEIEHDLSDRLDAWMAQQGDAGVETEARARERQKRGRNAKKTTPKQPSRKKRPRASADVR